MLTFASFQRSQTRREGRPENTGALSGNPRVERQMQQLCNDLERNAGKIKALHDRAAGPARTGDSARLEALRANRRQLTTQLKDCMRVLEPDLHGTIMERVKSQATRDLEQTYLHVWNDYQRTQKAGYTKHLWTILSGGIAYSFPWLAGRSAAYTGRTLVDDVARHYLDQPCFRGLYRQAARPCPVQR